MKTPSVSGLNSNDDAESENPVKMVSGEDKGLRWQLRRRAFDAEAKACGRGRPSDSKEKEGLGGRPQTPEELPAGYLLPEVGPRWTGVRSPAWAPR